MFYWLNRNKKISELRKAGGFTAKELAQLLKCDSIEITKVDGLTLKEVPETLRNKLIPIFRGDRYDNMPW
ncbi:MAG: transcriptional regulator [Bacillota bacterium]